MYSAKGGYEATICGGIWAGPCDRNGDADNGVAGVIGTGGRAAPADGLANHFDGCSHFVVVDPLPVELVLILRAIELVPDAAAELEGIWNLATNLSFASRISWLTTSSTACENNAESIPLKSSPTRAKAVEQYVSCVRREGRRDIDKRGKLGDKTGTRCVVKAREA